MNLNILIVEDSVSYAIELERIATEIGFNVAAVVDNSADALDFIFSELPDVILMDVNINGRLTGVDVAKKIRHLNIPILFITSFDDDETYREAQKSNLVGYIVKPVGKHTLNTTLKLLLNNSLNTKSKTAEIYKREDEEYIFFMKNKIYQKVNVKHVAYIKSDDNYCEFNLIDGSQYLLRIKLAKVEDLLADNRFIRCHRQYVVNQECIRSIDTANNSLEVLDQNIPYSRSKKADILSIGIFIR